MPGTFVYTPAAGHGADRRRGPDPVGDLHADRHGELHERDATSRSRVEGDADDHLGGAGGHHLRHGAERDAAECDGDVPGTFVYTPAAGDGAEASGRADAVGDLHADRPANYTTATATMAITVLKATPTITWATPAGIIYGTALSATQLNATASVPGTFVYTPAADAS